MKKKFLRLFNWYFGVMPEMSKQERTLQILLQVPMIVTALLVIIVPISWQLGVAVVALTTVHLLYFGSQLKRARKIRSEFERREQSHAEIFNKIQE